MLAWPRLSNSSLQKPQLSEYLWGLLDVICELTFIAVILSLTRSVANILKAVILSTVLGTGYETDVHCRSLYSL